MSSFLHRPATRQAYRMALMLVLYAAFVTSVALSADREALLAQVQAMTEGGERTVVAPRNHGVDAGPLRREARAR